MLESTLRQVRENITLCENCFLPTFMNCRFCADPRRDKNLICVVEKEPDALNLEKTRQFSGHYYVLGGFIDPLEKENLAQKRLSILILRLRKKTNLAFFSDSIKMVNLELILALTPRREGDFTSLCIKEQLKPLISQGIPIKITRLGRGLSSGAELEYADEETLRNALDGRK